MIYPKDTFEVVTLVPWLSVQKKREMNGVVVEEEDFTKRFKKFFALSLELNLKTYDVFISFCARKHFIYIFFSIKTHKLPLKLTLIIISWCSLELPHSTKSSVKLVLYRMSRLIFKSGAIFSLPPFYQNSKVILSKLYLGSFV